MKRFFLSLVLLLACQGWAFAVAFTSVAAGNWSADATWSGSGVPGNGDSVTIDHAVTVDVNTEIGTSGVAGTIDVEVNAAGSLTLAAGIQLRVNGDTRLDDSVLTLGAGANYQYGNGGSAQIYKIQYGSTTSQTNSRIVCNGTSGSHCLFNKEAGAGNGIIIRNINNGSVFGGLTASYTDFVDMGTSAFAYGSVAIDVNPSGANQELHLDHCTFTNCGGLNLQACPAARNVNLQYVTIDTPLTGPTVLNVFLTTTAATTGERVLKHIGGKYAYIGFAGSMKSFDIQDVTVHRMLMSASGVTDTSPTTEFKECFFPTIAVNTPTSIGIVGDEMENLILFSDLEVGSGFQGTGLSTSTGTITYTNFIIQQCVASEQPDGFTCGIQTTGGPWTYLLKNWLVLLNSRGRSSFGMVSNHGSAKTNMSMEHCTAGTLDHGFSGSNAWFAFNHGTDYFAHANHIVSCKSNLFWGPDSATGGNWALLYYPGSDETLATDAPRNATGTALATSTTTTINFTGKTFSTGTAQTLADSVAKVVIITPGAGDPPAGEERTITSNTASTVTVGTAFSAAPDSGSCVVKIVVPNSVTAANCNYNAHYNGRNGTVYDTAGRNGTTKLGYEGMNLTSSAIGANDINLGTGTGITAAGPKFVDPTRGCHNFTIYLLAKGLATEPSAWVNDGTTITVGSRRKHNSASWFNNESLWYRCKLEHAPTGVANDEPGVGSAWRTYWEFDVVDLMHQHCKAGDTITDSAIGLSSASYPLAMATWIRAGWAPTNATLKNAGHDGVTIGAVEVPGSVPVLMHQRKQQGFSSIPKRRLPVIQTNYQLAP